MKIQIASDLHQEANREKGRGYYIPEPKADILVLAGDIEIGAVYVTEYLKKAATQFKHIIYVMGNHEHEHDDIDQTNGLLKRYLKEDGISNIYVLDNETKQLEDVTFVGTTMFTDFSHNNPLVMHDAQENIRDFSVIKCGKDFLRPQDTYLRHFAARDFLRRETQKPGKKVVVTHYAPSWLSVHQKFERDSLNGYFAANAEDIVLDCVDTPLWIHGHMHDSFDYVLGNTRVVCNPLGTSLYPNYHYQLDLVIDV